MKNRVNLFSNIQELWETNSSGDANEEVEEGSMNEDYWIKYYSREQTKIDANNSIEKALNVNSMRSISKSPLQRRQLIFSRPFKNDEQLKKKTQILKKRFGIIKSPLKQEALTLIENNQTENSQGNFQPESRREILKISLEMDKNEIIEQPKQQIDDQKSKVDEQKEIEQDEITIQNKYLNTQEILGGDDDENRQSEISNSSFKVFSQNSIEISQLKIDQKLQQKKGTHFQITSPTSFTNQEYSNGKASSKSTFNWIKVPRCSHKNSITFKPLIGKENRQKNQLHVSLSPNPERNIEVKAGGYHLKNSSKNQMINSNSLADLAKTNCGSLKRYFLKGQSSKEILLKKNQNLINQSESKFEKNSNSSNLKSTLAFNSNERQNENELTNNMVGQPNQGSQFSNICLQTPNLFENQQELNALSNSCKQINSIDDQNSKKIISNHWNSLNFLKMSRENNSSSQQTLNLSKYSNFQHAQNSGIRSPNSTIYNFNERKSDSNISIDASILQNAIFKQKEKLGNTLLSKSISIATRPITSIGLNSGSTNLTELIRNTNVFPRKSIHPSKNLNQQIAEIQANNQIINKNFSILYKICNKNVFTSRGTRDKAPQNLLSVNIASRK